MGQWQVSVRGNDPWGDNHSNPYLGGGGTGYGSDDLPSYLEKMAIILDQMVGKIGTGSATVHQKAALYNCLSVLMEVADRGGFYDRMAAVMVGIFNEAENDPIVIVGSIVAKLVDVGLRGLNPTYGRIRGLGFLSVNQGKRLNH